MSEARRRELVELGFPGRWGHGARMRRALLERCVATCGAVQGVPRRPRSAHAHAGGVAGCAALPRSCFMSLAICPPDAADDGYDYLKHMRVLGRGQANLEGMPAVASADSDSAASEAGAGSAAPGPSVFLPAPALEAPEDDVKVIDASRLTVMQAVEAEGDAAVMAGGVTAFSRARERVRRGEQRELAELEEAMRALEEAEELGGAGGGACFGAGRARGAVEHGKVPWRGDAATGASCLHRACLVRGSCGQAGMLRRPHFLCSAWAGGCPACMTHH